MCRIKGLYSGTDKSGQRKMVFFNAHYYAFGNFIGSVIIVMRAIHKRHFRLIRPQLVEKYRAHGIKINQRHILLLGNEAHFNREADKAIVNFAMPIQPSGHRRNQNRNGMMREPEQSW